MDQQAKIYIAGHRGLVGSAIVRNLQAKGYTNLLLRTHAELDLAQPQQVDTFFAQQKPDHVFLAAAKVGGINANNTYPAEFIRQNLAIQTNVLHAAYKNSVDRLLFLGSSCIYPKSAPQPLKEDYLHTGELEPTNRPYALAKLAGIEQCWAYNRQYATRFMAVMPTNLYGPGDNYDLNSSHVLPALIRKIYEAKRSGSNCVEVWGTGTPRREFLYSDDMADACVFVMNLSESRFVPLLAANRNDGVAPLLNIGVGEDVTIAELAELICDVIGYTGEIVFDASKPDGTMRKLLDVGRMADLGWTAKIGLRDGIGRAYQAALPTFQSPILQ